MLKLPPLSLYIHFPWCVKKCPYCDFNSHTIQNTIPGKEYTDALIQDLESHLPDIQGREIISIFMGGGTPSAFPTKEMARLFEYIFKNIKLSEKVEITIEANPGTIEHGNFLDYKNMGINRVSLGVQSFQNDKLKALGRIHNDTQVEQSINLLTQAGFNNFNIDLMHGLPNQNLEDALFDLQSAINFKPTHLSWYQLTLEPNTPFHNNPPALPDEDALFDIETEGKQLIASAGFNQYEVSAYSKSIETRAQHNLNYWQFGDYIGIGAGAHGKLTDIKTGIITRIWKYRHPERYLSKPDFIRGMEGIMHQDLPYEFMLNALRLNDGFKINQFENYTGLPIQTIQPQIDLAIEKNMLKQEKGRIYPSLFGQRYLNDLIDIFSPGQG